MPTKPDPVCGVVEVLVVEVDVLGEVEEELPEFWLVEALVADSVCLVSSSDVELSLDVELVVLSVDLLLELLSELVELSDADDIDVDPLTPFCSDDVVTVVLLESDLFLAFITNL
jgi:hypothetical protein